MIGGLWSSIVGCLREWVSDFFVYAIFLLMFIAWSLVCGHALRGDWTMDRTMLNGSDRCLSLLWTIGCLCCSYVGCLRVWGSRTCIHAIFFRGFVAWSLVCVQALRGDWTMDWIGFLVPGCLCFIRLFLRLCFVHATFYGGFQVLFLFGCYFYHGSFIVLCFHLWRAALHISLCHSHTFRCSATLNAFSPLTLCVAGF